jgi:transposase InsO family protein
VAATAPASKNDVRKPRGPGKAGCYHCKGEHWLLECPTASAEDKIRLLKQHHACPKHNKAMAAVESSASDATAPARRDRWLNVGGVRTAFVFDSGANRTFISVEDAERMLEAPCATRVELDTPMTVRTATGGEGGELAVRYIVKTSATLELENDVVLDVEELHAYATEGMHVGEVLIGRRTMHAMGIDIPAIIVSTLTDRRGEEDARCGGVPEDGEEEAMRISEPVGEEQGTPPDVGVIDEAEIDEALDKALVEAAKNGMPMWAVTIMSEEVKGPLRNAFRTRLTNDAPAKVDPVKVDVLPSIYSLKQGVRRYSKAASDYIAEMMKMFVQFNYVVEDSSATVASPAYPVPKANADPSLPILHRWRLTVDLRGPNAHTRPMVFPLPRLEMFVDIVAGMQFFGTLDLFNGYWQLPLHEDSQPFFCIKTDRGVFRPTRLIQGSRNAAGPFQAAVTKVLGDAVGSICIVYIDDVLVFGRTWQEFVANWLTVLRRLHEAGFKVNALKTKFYQREVKYCGRLFSAEGVRFDPAHAEAVAKMPKPATAAELRTYLASVNWMRTSIPRYSTLSIELQQLLTAASRLAKDLRTPSLQRITLAEAGWDERHDEAFQHLNEALRAQVTLSYPDDNLATCVFTDASKQAWSGVLTQVPVDQLELPILQQQHKPLAFVGGYFQGAQLNWPTVELEGFAIKETCVRLSHLLQRGHSFTIYTDHRNLVYLFSSDVRQSDGRKQAVDRIERWIVIMGQFNYKIKHVKGEDNVVADMLSRWGAPVAETATADDTAAEVAAAVDDVQPPTDATVSRFSAGEDAAFTVADAPEIAEVVEEQIKLKSDDMEALGLHRDDDGVWVDNEQRIYIPDSRFLRIRLCIAAHQGLGGHRGEKVTRRWLQEKYWWPKMRDNVKMFCQTCLGCQRTRGAFTIPRAVLQHRHATGPNQVLHFDYTYIRAATADTPGRFTYVLVIRDEFSKLTELVPTANADACTVVNSLLSWFARHGIVRQWVSDRGTHFLNTVMEELATKLQASHHFSAAYAPWSNGMVERVNRELRELLSSLMFSAKLQNHMWPTVLPIVASIINNTPTDTLRGYAPLQVHTGREPTSPLHVAVHTNTPLLAEYALDDAQFCKKVENLIKTLENVRNEVQTHGARAQKTPASAQKVDFDVGDYVLVARRGAKNKDKTRSTWTGPARVMEKLTEVKFKIQDIVADTQEVVHAKMLKRYADSKLVITPQLKEFAAYNGGIYRVQAIVGHRMGVDGMEMKVHWQGFSIEAATWEPATNVAEDVPDMFRVYAAELTDVAAKNSLLAMLQ